MLNATILGSGVTLRTQRQGSHAGLAGWEYLYIDSDTALDRDCTVIELELDGELELFEHHTRD